MASLKPSWRWCASNAAFMDPSPSTPSPLLPLYNGLGPQTACCVQVLSYNFPDPGVSLINNKYYAFSTNGGKGNVQTATSTDMVRTSPAHEHACRPNVAAQSLSARL